MENRLERERRQRKRLTAERKDRRKATRSALADWIKKVRPDLLRLATRSGVRFKATASTFVYTERGSGGEILLTIHTKGKIRYASATPENRTVAALTYNAGKIFDRNPKPEGT